MNFITQKVTREERWQQQQLQQRQQPARLTNKEEIDHNPARKRKRDRREREREKNHNQKKQHGAIHIRCIRRRNVKIILDSC